VRFVAAFLVVVSCGGHVAATGDGGAPPGGEGGFDFCAAMKERASSCKTSFDPATCATQEACIEGPILDEVQTPLETCLSSSACGTTSDACLVPLGEPYVDVDPFASYETKCAAKRAACQSFPEDYCALKYAVGKPEVIAQFSACMDLACDGVPACFQGVLSGYDCHT
jgi:hypothetical protein